MGRLAHQEDRLTSKKRARRASKRPSACPHPRRTRLLLEVLEERSLPAPLITEYAIPTLASATVGITAGPDGNVWFVEQVGNRIGQITPAGAITEFPLPTPNSQPVNIIAGPDANLWFTEFHNNAIGRITPAGAITEFPIANPLNSQPYGIATGPDGNLWFTESNAGANKIGKITPAGTISEYRIPTTNSRPTAITNGSDGNLWFTEFNASQIGRITTAGTGIVEFPVPTGSSQPFDIKSGPDGNLWFTEAGANQIGRVTLTGTFAEFGVPTTTTLTGIAPAPDGHLWVTEGTGDQIGRVSATGTLVEFPITRANANPTAIAAGPDGNLWFAEQGANRIAQLSGITNASAWSPIGPAPVHGPGFEEDFHSGRINVAAPDPTDANTLFIGADDGGIWKTTDWLDPKPAWTPLTDNQPSLAVATHGLVIYPRDHNILYAAVNAPHGGVLKSINQPGQTHLNA